MSDTIRFGDIVVSVTRKQVKHVHLSVHPPNGRVTLVAPNNTCLEVARAYAATRLGWIRKQRLTLEAQLREPRRRYVNRESHYLWGRRYLMSVVNTDSKPTVTLDHRQITLFVRSGSTQATRERVVRDWQRLQLHKTVPALVAKWERKLSVQVSSYHLQRMKTKWGSCNPAKRAIRLNTDIVSKPRDLLEYVIVHEMIHLLDPTHSRRFIETLNAHYPSRREARAELNQLPLSAHRWT